MITVDQTAPTWFHLVLRQINAALQAIRPDNAVNITGGTISGVTISGSTVGGPYNGTLGQTTPDVATVTTFVATGLSTQATTQVASLTATQLGATGILLSGTYTPTLTNTTNISASTALACQYFRVGSVITVSGGVTMTPTLLATLTTMGISLPIASNIANPENLGGAANSSNVVSASAAVFGDAANDRATLQMVSVGTGSETFYFSFSYQVI